MKTKFISTLGLMALAICLYLPAKAQTAPASQNQTMPTNQKAVKHIQPVSNAKPSVTSTTPAAIPTADKPVSKHIMPVAATNQKTAGTATTPSKATTTTKAGKHIMPVANAKTSATTSTPVNK